MTFLPVAYNKQQAQYNTSPDLSVYGWIWSDLEFGNMRSVSTPTYYLDIAS